MLETRKVDNNKIRKALFVNLRPYVTYMLYLVPEVSVSFYIVKRKNTKNDIVISSVKPSLFL